MIDFTEFQSSFQEMAVLARGGQKVVYSAKHFNYGDVVIKLYFTQNDPRAHREISIVQQLNINCVPKIYETGTLFYEGKETLYTIEQRIMGEVLRKRIEQGPRFSLQEAVNLLEQGLVVYECLTGKNPFREGARSALEILQKTETITPVIYTVRGDTQQQFMALLGSLMGKYPSRRPKNAKQALDWLTAAKPTLQY